MWVWSVARPIGLELFAVDDFLESIQKFVLLVVGSCGEGGVLEGGQTRGNAVAVGHVDEVDELFPVSLQVDCEEVY